MGQVVPEPAADRALTHNLAVYADEVAQMAVIADSHDDDQDSDGDSTADLLRAARKAALRLGLLTLLVVLALNVACYAGAVRLTGPWCLSDGVSDAVDSISDVKLLG
jgi:hypothetical protein